ncbi:DNA-J related domain-containing protein [Rhizoctonia solani AG-1 IA]|uniref:DNA-J related domain-containing protein n=1 Tax=Thanatephorus cucumeris (strain AG1-IA) TaxID=983506 RepID=L8WEB2_THACA|nr:DNA-J related domain-containing protein [Rhizoctonia solani AG-1 IA]
MITKPLTYAHTIHSFINLSWTFFDHNTFSVSVSLYTHHFVLMTLTLWYLQGHLLQFIWS